MLHVISAHSDIHIAVYEMTDALVVVVSEERGTVRTFSRGRIKTVGDKNELSSIIGASGIHPADKRWPDVQVQIKVSVKAEKRK